MPTDRRKFLKNTTAAGLGLAFYPWKASEQIMTVGGSIKPRKMGLSLIHEHVLVDFIGADKVSPDRWERKAVVEKVLPYLLEIRKLGCDTLIECTPAYLGRDVLLLQELSGKSGLHILTNTGYYGARDNQHLPAHALTESAEQLAERWVGEFENGIDGTEVRPGFMKIGVNPGPLSEMHQKLIRAAAITHKATGLTIASHTGPAQPAFEQMDMLEEMGVKPEAFIWVHAQSEKDLQKHIEAARRGAWISLDGVSQQNLDWYLKALNTLREAKLLGKVLLSHDAGWYRPGEENGGEFRPYTDIFNHFLPLLRENGYGKKEIGQLMIENPAEAFSIRKRIS